MGQTRQLSRIGRIYSVAFMCLIPAFVLAEENATDRISLLVDFGQDTGQALGTLWEAKDTAGRPLAGAGFQTAYNTQDRSDRRMLQVFVRTQQRPIFQTDQLPRPTSDAGTYLFGYDGALFSYGRNAIDKGLRRWNADWNQWTEETQAQPLAVQVGGIPMVADERSIRYGDQVLLELPLSDSEEGVSRLGEWYYADGQLVVREFNALANGGKNELVAYAWSPGQSIPLDYHAGVRQKLSKWGEFIYCFGQAFSGESTPCVVAASNQGSVHFLNENQWKTVREPDGKSFQIYASINYRDRLLFGHYPTGELLDWAGSGLFHLKGQPPSMEGVSRNAREAQTLAVYGGELHVGVWPWGEVWRQDAWNGQWDFLGRLFTHPLPSDQWTHPYEAETTALDPVLNRWGQRVTSMVPLGDSLYISTSAKGPNPYEPKFTFLNDGKHLEYGAVHRYRAPGCLAVPLAWKDRPTRLDFLLTEQSIEVRQDGSLIGSAQWSDDYPSILHEPMVSLGSGTYGPFRGRSVTTIDDQAQKPPTGMRGAYLHVHRHIHPQSDPIEWATLFQDQCARMRQFGISTLMPFVSDSSGRAHYASALMQRRYQDADPIEMLADELRKHEIGFHPVIPIIVCGGEQPQGILLEHPEWALRNLDGSPMGYISPAHPDARRWLVDVVREVVSKYSPDGVLFDYLRYANRPHRLDPVSEQRFLASLPENCTEQEQQRRFQVFKEAELTELARMLSEAVRQHSRTIPISAYVWGHHVAKEHLIAQVWPQWVAAGYLDAINVSGYFHREKYGDQFLDEFRKRMEGVIELNRNLPHPAQLSFALGLITSHGHVESSSDILSYQKIGRELGMHGSVYFTWEYLLPFIDELPPH